jgi:hypothetical protein
VGRRKCAALCVKSSARWRAFLKNLVRRHAKLLGVGRVLI